MATNDLGAGRFEVEADASSFDRTIDTTKQKVKDLGKVAEETGNKQKAANAKVEEGQRRNERAAARAEQAEQRATAAANKRLATLEKTILAEGRSREESIRARIADVATGDQAERLNKLLDAQLLKRREIAKSSTGISEGQRNAAMRMLPAQATDVITQVAGGQSLGLIALQQGGQIKDSFGGLLPAIKGVSSALMGVVNPFTVTAAAAAAMGYAAYQGSQETEKLAKSLIESGNSAGLSVSGFRQLQDSMDEMAGTTKGSAVDAIMAVASTGKFSGEQMEIAAVAAEKWRVATGTAVDETVAQFAKIAGDPVQALLELNSKYGFVTAAQIEHIRKLDETVSHTQAATEAMRLMGAMIDERAPKIVGNLGYIERAARSVKDAFRNMWDGLKSVGRDSDLGGVLESRKKQLEAVQKSLANAKASGNTAEATRFAAAAKQMGNDIATLEQRYSKYKETIGDSTAQTAEERASVEATVALQKRVADAKATTLGLEARIAAERKKQVAAGVTDKALLDQMEQVMREQEKRSKSPQRSSGASSVSAAKKADSEEMAYNRQVSESKKQALKAELEARTISSETYYNKMREIAEQSTQAEIAALEKQRSQVLATSAAKKDAANTASAVAAIDIKIATAREKGAAATAALNSQEERSNQQRKESLEAFRQSIQLQTKNAQQQAVASLRSITMSDEQISRENALQKILENKANILAQIARDQGRGSLSESDASQRRMELEEETSKALRATVKGFEDADAARADWSSGIGRALGNIASESGNYSGQIADAISGAFNSGADALTQFATTGKASFSDLANSIVQDLAKIAAKTLANYALQAMFGGMGSSGTANVTNMMGATSATISDRAIGGILGKSGFAQGGYTGSGSKYEVAGVAHKEEVVFSKEDVARNGGVAATEALRRNGVGYVASSRSSSGVSSGSVAVQIVNNGPPVNAESDGTTTGADGNKTVRLILSSIASDISSGGVVGKAIKGRFGVKERV